MPTNHIFTQNITKYQYVSPSLLQFYCCCWNAIKSICWTFSEKFTCEMFLWNKKKGNCKTNKRVKYWNASVVKEKNKWETTTAKCCIRNDYINYVQKCNTHRNIWTSPRKQTTWITCYGDWLCFCGIHLLDMRTLLYMWMCGSATQISNTNHPTHVASNNFSVLYFDSPFNRFGL